MAAAGSIVPDARVVAGRHDLGAQAPGAIQQCRKLQIAVAARAWDRRAAGGVFGDEVGDHLFLELAFTVDQVVGDSDRCRDPARVVQIVERTARAEACLPLPLVVQLHRQANDLVALLREKRSGD